MSVRNFIFPLVLGLTLATVAGCAQPPPKNMRAESRTVASWQRLPPWVIFTARDIGFRPRTIKGKILHCTVEYSRTNQEYCLDADHLTGWAQAQRAGGSSTLSSSFVN